MSDPPVFECFQRLNAIEHLSSLHIPLVVVLIFIIIVLISLEIFSGEFASQSWDVETKDEMTECKRDFLQFRHLSSV